MVASFDIFDTLLTRSVGNPKAVFLLLGKVLHKEGIIKCTPQQFLFARATAQNIAYNKSNGRDITIQQIYEELAFALHLSKDVCNIIIDKELELESKLLRAVPGALERIKKEKLSGKKILFISDMYLPSSFIIAQLQKNGFEVDNNCYVSNEHFKSKHTGELFRHISAELKLPPSSFYHFGDHEKSDFKIPKSLKWNALHYADISLNRYEKILNSDSIKTEGMTTALSGASRYTRLSMPLSGTNKILIEISASVVAPLLTGFLLWVFKRAKILGIKKLYYFSRDGQILHKMSKILGSRLDIDIELHYLYSSRKSWQFAALTDITPETLSWIFKKKGLLTIEMVFKRVFQHADDFEKILEAEGFSRNTWKINLTDEEIKKLYNTFKRQEVKDKILSTAKEHRQLLVQYLDQEGLTSGEPYGIVDIGWLASSQNNLAQVLEHRDIPKPAGFYLAFKEKFVQEGAGIKEGYFVDQNLNVGYHGSLKNKGTLLETFCHADHGSLKHYEMADGKVVPVLESKINQRVVDWGLPVVHETLCKFCENLLLNKELIDPFIDFRPTSVKLLKLFSYHPDLQEANSWGSLELECNTLETKYSPLAEPYSFKEILQCFIRGRIYRSYWSWEEGSLMLTPKPKKMILKYSVKAGSLARRLLGRPPW